MFGEDTQEVQAPIGVSVEEAGDIATKNVVVIAAGTVGMFYLIYKFLIK